MATVVFISCVSKKLPHKVAAKELYTSPLFKMNLAYAQKLNPAHIYILSAKYGLVGLDEKIDTYDLTLNTMKQPQLRAWAKRVIGQLKNKIDFENDEAIFLAGERYRKYILPHFAHSLVPMQGLGIGKQLQFLKHAIR